MRPSSAELGSGFKARRSIWANGANVLSLIVICLDVTVSDPRDNFVMSV
jgi:hypothetical protein